MLCPCGFTTPTRDGLPYDLLPIYYPAVGPCAIEFWLVCYGTYGRITHVVIPRLKVVIFDLDVASALSIAELLECHLKDFQAGYEAAQRSSTPPLLIGVMDMTFNYGHQLMNHLSGLERLLEQAVAADSMQELWISGVEFFPSTEALFPELAQKIVRVADRWETYHLLKCGRYLPLRVGTNVFYNKVGSRILRQPSSQEINARPTARNPLVAVTIRSAGRQCLNLPIVVQQVAFELIKIFPNLGLVLDGWVLPDSQLLMRSALATMWSNKFYRDSIGADLALAQRIYSLLPSDVVVSNLIGQSMSESLSGLYGIDAYFAHVGTLQHKVSFFTKVKGVVHTAVSQLTVPDTGHFEANSGFAPSFLSTRSVVDVPAAAARGNGYQRLRDHGDKPNCVRAWPNAEERPRKQTHLNQPPN